MLVDPLTYTQRHRLKRPSDALCIQTDSKPDLLKDSMKLRGLLHLPRTMAFSRTDIQERKASQDHCPPRWGTWSVPGAAFP